MFKVTTARRRLLFNCKSGVHYLTPPTRTTTTPPRVSTSRLSLLKLKRTMSTTTSILPVIFTPLTQEAKQIIDKNHALHHVLFNSNKFHNHLPHHVVSNLAQGCDAAGGCSFQELWDSYDKYLDKKPPLAKDYDVDEGNWQDGLGKMKYYANYLKFFEKIIDRDGIPAVVKQYALRPDMASRLVAGAVHPLIHIGYGLESMDIAIASEGLAEICIHRETVKPILDQFQPSDSLKEKRPLLDILKEMRADKTLDSAVSFKDENKTDNVIAHASLLEKYLNQWIVKAEAGDVHRSLAELVETACLMVFASSRPGHPKSPVLDFFYMHVLTSTVSLRQLVPHLTPSQCAQLLRAHFGVLLMYYVSRGRPELTRSYVVEYPVKRSWKELAKASFGHEDAHVSKVIRALHLAEQDWGVKDGLWIHAGQMCIETIVDKGGDWSFSGMFDEIWD